MDQENTIQRCPCGGEVDPGTGRTLHVEGCRFDDSDPATDIEPAEVTADEPELCIELHSLVDPTVAEQHRLAGKPATAHLKPGAVVPGEGMLPIPTFGEGDRIVVERFASHMAGHPWFDTRVLVVNTIDDAAGVAWCRDEKLKHSAAIGWRDPFSKVFLAPRTGDPFKVRGVVTRAHTDPPENPVRPGQGDLPGKTEVVTVRPESALGNPLGGPAKKTRRGRPPGSKNRPKEVIQAEKKQAQMTAKRKTRGAK